MRCGVLCFFVSQFRQLGSGVTAGPQDCLMVWSQRASRRCGTEGSGSRRRLTSPEYLGECRFVDGELFEYERHLRFAVVALVATLEYRPEGCSVLKAELGYVVISTVSD